MLANVKQRYQIGHISDNCRNELLVRTLTNAYWLNISLSDRVSTWWGVCVCGCVSSWSVATLPAGLQIRLPVCLSDWMRAGMPACRTRSLIHSLIYWLIHRLTRSSAHSPTQLLTHPPSEVKMHIYLKPLRILINCRYISLCLSSVWNILHHITITLSNILSRINSRRSWYLF